MSGCYVFGSYNKSNGREKHFIESVMDEYGSNQGLFFDFRERVRKQSAVQCLSCGEHIDTVSEMGVDVLPSAEMIKHAAMREHEYLAIVSSDRDFIPLIQYLKDQGQRVIHVATKHPHRDMRSITWKQFTLQDSFAQLFSIKHNDYLVFSVPQAVERVEEAVSWMNSKGAAYRIVDVTEPSQIHDKALRFLLETNPMYVTAPGLPHGQRRSIIKCFLSVHEKRDNLRKQSINHCFPLILKNGKQATYVDEHGKWTKVISRSETIFWK